ncbi:unnamed protein product [Phaeothamnion confervicola]
MKEVREVTMSASAQIALFSLFIAVFQRTNFSKIIKGSLAMSLGGSVDLFKQLDPETRRKFVKANLAASLDDKTGNAVFESVVGPLMGRTTSYRENFEYKVRALDAPPNEPASPTKALQSLIYALHDPKTYFWMHQSLQYDLRKAVNEEFEHYAGPFELWFAFDEKTLDAAVRNDEIYFREVLKLKETDLQTLTTLSADDLEAFLRTVMDLKVETRQAGQDLQCKFDVKVDRAAAPLLRVKIAKISGPRNSGLRISFNMPQLREATRFVVVLPQPTENPIIEFTRSQHMRNLQPVRFFSRLKPGALTELVDGEKVDETNPPKDPKSFNMQIDGWTFPTSGVMFVWDNRPPLSA